MGREPTPEEIAAEMGMTPTKVREILKISQQPLSLETPIGEEEHSQLGDFIEDEDAAAPLEAVSEIMQKEELDQVLATLTHRERKIIELRFGLKGEQPQTLEEVGQKFGLTRERIRQIEAKTLAKLTSYRDTERLRGFLDEERPAGLTRSGRCAGLRAYMELVGRRPPQTTVGPLLQGGKRRADGGSRARQGLLLEATASAMAARSW